MSKRKALSKKVRFEVFKRDKFTCQYCGATAETTVLHVDHIIPVADGGQNDILNLITACQPCNAGKGATPLSDETAIAKQRVMLEDLEAKREQIEMLRMWRDELADLDAIKVNFLAEQFIREAKKDREFGPGSLSKIQAWVKQFTPEELLTAWDTSCQTYFERDADGVTDESFSKAFNYTPRIAHYQKHRPDERAFWKEVHYVRAIIRNKFSGCDLVEAKRLIAECLNHGGDFEEERLRAIRSQSFYSWQREMEAITRG